jgi:hypothetical protein
MWSINYQDDKAMYPIDRHVRMYHALTRKEFVTFGFMIFEDMIELCCISAIVTLQIYNIDLNLKYK